jgi:Xaa-Pro aminopeptidase
MKHNFYFWLIFLLMIPKSSISQEYQSFFPPEEFQARWEKVFDQIGDNAIAIIPGAPDPGGFVYPRQTNSFFYLCGVETSYSYLILDGKTRKATLYLPPGISAHNDRVLTLENADRVKQLAGVDEVLSTEKLSSLDSRVIYTPFSPAEGQGQSRGELVRRDAKIALDYWDGRLSRENHFIALLKTRYPRAEVKNLTPILDEMRNIKSPREIELVRRASKLAALAVIEAIRTTKAGIYEYQLDAAARYVHLVNGAKLEGYRSITASGVHNIRDGHYYFNSSPLKDDDLVLMDFAPDYGYYTSDIGRMWPVNGKFNQWQRELCQIILTYHKEIIKRIRPGVTAAQIMDEAKEVMEKVLEKTKFSKPCYETAARKMVETGGGVFSHNVGMAVHDVGSYRSKPLQPGMVFAVDPQLRVPEENLYMRVEDTIVVTQEGVENLTQFAPSELDEIEKMVEGSGIVQKFPAVMKSIYIH